MKNKTNIVCLAFAALAVALSAGCVSSGMSFRNHIQTQGLIENNRYHAPNGAFSIVVPKLVQPGARIVDNLAPNQKGGDVNFQDDMGAWINVVYLASEKGGLAKHQDDLFETFVTGDGITVLHREAVMKEDGKQLFAIITAKEKSNLMNADTGRRLDLFEGVLVFHRNGHVFRLSSQDRRGILSRKPVKVSERAEYMKRELMVLYSQMDFSNSSGIIKQDK